MIRTVVAILCSSLLAASAGAATLAGVTLPDTYQVDGKTLVLNGMGLRTLTIFNVKVYVAGLYVSQKSHDAQQILNSKEPRAVVLQFLHAGSKADVEKEYRAGEAKNCGAGNCDPADEPQFEKLVAAAPAVNPGDTTTYIYTAGRVRVFANTRMIADFPNQDLAYRLLEGFIGAHPPSEELKRQLLGLPG